MPSPLNSHHYALIVAGGSGTRLWPLSRKNRPKQFQSFIKEQTLLQHMVSHVEDVLPIEHVFILATPEFAPIILEQLPSLPPENLLYEPARRDTGPAMILGMMQISQRDPEATTAVLWADHNIEKASTFSELLEVAFQASEQHPHALITMGSKPTYPATGFGYIQMADEDKAYGNHTVFAVKRFVEKPDLATATEFVASWEYLWNMGYNVMRTDQFLKVCREINPELKETLNKLQKACENQDHQAIASVYEELPKISVDYLVVQHLKDLYVVPADIGWNDIGSWKALHEILRDQFSDGVVTRGNVITLESEECLIYSKDRLITAVGLKDIIIVDDGDAILVMHKDHAQAIKTLTQKLEVSNPELL